MSLTLNNVGRKIGREWILQKISLEVAEGECLALLGPSGCGKSSTLRLIAGLDKLNDGSIHINGKDVSNIPAIERRIGMVFQSYALFPHLTIEENLIIGLKVRKVASKVIKDRVGNILSLLQLDSFAGRKPAQLSGGQRQRVALARALLRDPLVYLLDEPMSNLDAQLREDLRPELKRLILNGREPVIYVTHDQHEAMAMSNRIAVLRNGMLEQIGTPKELYKNPTSLFVACFIGRPQINQLKVESGIIKAIRPEDIKIDPNGLNSRVLYQEWLGNNQLLLLDTSKGRLRMLCSGDTEISEAINVSWSKEKEHLFDEKTQQRISLDK